MILDMSDALGGLTQSVTLKSVTTATVDFVETETITSATIAAVVQPASMEQINPDLVDWSLKYIQVHSESVLLLGERISWLGDDYKIIQRGNYYGYGFNEVFAEEIK